MIKVFATTEHGNGNVMQIGEYADWDDIEIKIGVFQPDVIITFHEK